MMCGHFDGMADLVELSGVMVKSTLQAVR